MHKRHWVKSVLLSLMVMVGIGSVSTWAISRALIPTPVGEAKAPDPHAFSSAVVQVYGADVWGVRGRFAIHTWIATKAKGDSTYRIYQVIGWQLQRRGTVVSITEGMPDRPWFRSAPILLHQITGERAQPLVAKIHDAALRYPYAGEYTMWPGPNSNSFTAWVGLEVPELGLDLPAKALGDTWMQVEHKRRYGASPPPT